MLIRFFEIWLNPEMLLSFYDNMLIITYLQGC